MNPDPRSRGQELLRHQYAIQQSAVHAILGRMMSSERPRQNANHRTESLHPVDTCAGKPNYITGCLDTLSPALLEEQSGHNFHLHQ